MLQCNIICISPIFPRNAEQFLYQYPDCSTIHEALRVWTFHLQLFVQQKLLWLSCKPAIIVHIAFTTNRDTYYIMLKSVQANFIMYMLYSLLYSLQL